MIGGALLAATLLSLVLFSEKIPDKLIAVLPAEPETAGLPPGAEVPQFDLTDIGGNRVTSSDLGGDRTALVFVSSTCPYCGELFAGLQDLEGGDAALLFISAGGLAEGAQVRQKLGVSWPVLFDSTGAASTAFEIQVVPTVYVAENGKIASQAQGMPGALEAVRTAVGDGGS